MKIAIVILLTTFYLCTTNQLLKPSLANHHIQSEQTKEETIKLITLTGRIIMKPWSKSAESWNAGGSEYYVLDVGDAEIELRSAEEGVILRSSDQVSMEKFAEYIGKSVQVTGKYVPAMPYEPQNPIESFPMDMNGQPLPRGSGFQVYSVTAI